MIHELYKLRPSRSPFIETENLNCSQYINTVHPCLRSQDRMHACMHASPPHLAAHLISINIMTYPQRKDQSFHTRGLSAYMRVREPGPGHPGQGPRHSTTSTGLRQTDRRTDGQGAPGVRPGGRARAGASPTPRHRDTATLSLPSLLLPRRRYATRACACLGARNAERRTQNTDNNSPPEYPPARRARARRGSPGGSR